MIFQTIIEYCKGKVCHFYFAPVTGVTDKNEIVVLVHGLIRRSLNFYQLGKKLSRLGYTVCVYDYRTTRKTMPEHGKDFKKYLERIAADNPDKKINIVTHSMGGILTRLALGHLEKTATGNNILSHHRIKRIVMLAPPHKGSHVAKFVCRFAPFLGKLIKPLPGLSNAPDSEIHTFPVPQGVEIGIVAGRFDNEVRIEYTHLPGQQDHVVIPAEHSLMMYMPSAINKTIKFLETGHF